MDGLSNKSGSATRDVTGVRVKGCYAATTTDCGGKLSREHALSRGVLKILSRGRSLLEVANQPWQSEAWVRLATSIDSLAVKNLCKRHNELLSPLDTMAKRFVQSLADCTDHVANEQSGCIHRWFDGRLLELWMLKALCGSFTARHTPDATKPPQWCAPKDWLDILFHGAEMPPGTGLYRRIKSRPLIEAAESAIYIRPLTVRSFAADVNGVAKPGCQHLDIVIGMEIVFFSFEFCFFMARVGAPGLVFRPSLAFYGEPADNPRALIALSWDGKYPTEDSFCRTKVMPYSRTTY